MTAAPVSTAPNVPVFSQAMIHFRKTQRTRSVRPLEFQQLEPRRMLVQSAIELPAENLITNGDFESFVQQSDSNFFDPSHVTGWNAMDGAGNEIPINLHVHQPPVGTFLSLDSVGNVFDTVFQDVETVLGQQYVLAFDFVDERIDNPNAPANDFELFWDGQLLGTFTAGDSIQTAAFEVIGGSLPQTGGQPDDATRTRLEFRDGRAGSDRTGDGHSALIDNVRLVKVSAAEITNGSFENITPVEGPLLPSQNVPGWNTWGLNDDDHSMRIEESVAGQNGTDGNRFLNLDSAENHVDRIYQVVQTIPGETYFITFDMRVDGSQDSDRDELRLRWNDAWAATFRSGTEEFQKFGVVVSADSASTLLVIREPGDEPGDGSGPLIDNLRIFQIDRVINDLQVDIDPSTDGLNGTARFSAGSGPTSVSASLNLSHETGEELTSARVTILNIVNANQEFLAVDVGTTAITQDYNPATGVLQLQGAASIQDYQNVLQSLTYDNTTDNPSTVNRTIAFRITDTNIFVGNKTSPPSSLDLTVASTNFAPQIESIDDRQADFGRPMSVNVVATDRNNDPISYTLSHTGIAAGHNTPGIDDNGRITWSPSQAGDVDLTVRATDPSGEFAEQAFTVSVNEFQPFSGTGSLSNIPVEFRAGIYDTAPTINIDTSKSYEAIINTTAGQMRFELLDDSATLAVNNFVNLARDGYFDGIIFHRVLDAFVGQGGDPTGTGTGGPGYSFVDESPISTFETGHLAMANSGPNTNGSQFFVVFNDITFITSHTLFGRITSGQNVLDQIVRTHVRVGNNEVPTGDPPTVITSITINEQ